MTTASRRQHTLEVLVENSPGVLARVAGLFSRRAFNIDSLTVGPTQDPTISKMVIVVGVEGHSLEQVIAQLDTVAGGASSVLYYLAADVAGDVPLTNPGTASILLGKTTATVGAAIDCIDMDYHYQRLTVETIGTVYVVVWLNAGTANANIRLQWRA